MLRVTSKYDVYTTKCYREHTLGMIYILSFLLCMALLEDVVDPPGLILHRPIIIMYA